MFSTRFETFLPFSSNLKLSSVSSFTLESLKFVVWERVNLDRTEDTLVKGENEGFQNFLIFQKCSQNSSLLGPLKVGIV